MKAAGAIIDFFANLLGFARKRQELVNAPEIQANKKAKTDAELKDSAAKAIEQRDVDEVTRRLSE